MNYIPYLLKKIRGISTVGFIVYLKFIYSEKATNFGEISTVDLSYGVTVNSMAEISQNFVAFSVHMNFNIAPYI